MKTIRVTGKGNLKIHPDITRIVITLEGTEAISSFAFIALNIHFSMIRLQKGVLSHN